MATKLWSNVQVAMQSAIAAAKTITAITKASPGVVTSAAHGYTNGDYVYLEVLGMRQLNKMVCRVASAATDTFQLEGLDTTAFDTFTSGTAKKVTLGTTITTATDINVSGGETDQIDVSTIHDTVKQTKPGAANPTVVSMNMLWDPSDAGQVALKSAADSSADRAFMFTFADAAKWVFVGSVGFTHSPTGAAQQKVTTPCTITANGRPSTFSS